MLDNTDVGLEADLDVPAISIQFSCAIGQTRNLTLTTGIRLDATKQQLDNVLDKVVAAADRQKKLFDLEQTRMLLKNEEQNLHQFRQQLTAQEVKFSADWLLSGRRGEWRAVGGQKSALDGLHKNVENSIDRIKQLRKTIEEMEGQCR